MKCAEINIHIDRFLDKQSNSEELLAFEDHASHCTECAKKLKTAKSLASGLRNQPLPPHTAKFKQRAFAEVRRQYKDAKQRNHAYSFATGFATAAVASLAIWFSYSLYVPDTYIDQPQMIAVAMNQAQTVSLIFDSHADIQQAKLRIDLPDNMELDGYPGRRELTWQTSLKKGQNILDLPIMATRDGQGELIAQLKYDGTVKILRVVLKTIADEV